MLEENISAGDRKARQVVSPISFSERTRCILLGRALLNILVRDVAIVDNQSKSMRGGEMASDERTHKDRKSRTVWSGDQDQQRPG